MRVLVTAGGTREPIDDVRVIANTSTGRLGCRIAEAAVAAGHNVLLLHGVQAARPGESIRSHVFDTAADLGRLLDEHAPGVDAVIHAAAVSDYVPERATGKISSESQAIVLHLHRAPKLIDGLRGLNPGGVLVGFKLTSSATETEQLTVARRLLTRARLDLVVANDVGRIGDDDHRVLFVDGDGIVDRCEGKQRIAAALVTEISRLSRSRSQEAAS